MTDDAAEEYDGTLSGPFEEIEILRGPNVRVTNAIAQADGREASIMSIADFALVEANPGIQIVPGAFMVIGPVVGLFLALEFGQAGPGGLVAILSAIGGALLWRESQTHSVTVRLIDARSFTLYRTQRLADARLFHAAIAKAIELRRAAAEESADIEEAAEAETAPAAASDP